MSNAAKPPTNQMIQRPQSAALAVSGTFSDKNQVTAMLERRGKDFHLVSPTTECTVIPEGCGVSFAAVLIDEATETYPQENKQALHRVALDKIASAAGITWDPRASGRIDNGSDPHYCMFRVVGHIRQFDGTTTCLIGTKELDARDGSQLALSAKPGDLAMQRKHIVSHAETKARLRAIASLGIRRSYTKEELKKPFVCAKLSFTGETNDPELRRAFALKRADAFLAGAQSLYGAPLLPDAGPKALGMAPPPVGSVPDAEFESERIPPPARREEPPPQRQAQRPPSNPPPAQAPAPQAPPAAPRAAAPAPDPRQGEMPYGGGATRQGPPAPPQRPRSGLVIPGGKSKGTPIESAEGRDLAYWIERIGKELDAGTSRYPEKDRLLHDTMSAERDFRLGVDPQDDFPDEDPNDPDHIPF